MRRVVAPEVDRATSAYGSYVNRSVKVVPTPTMTMTKEETSRYPDLQADGGGGSWRSD